MSRRFELGAIRHALVGRHLTDLHATPDRLTMTRPGVLRTWHFLRILLVDRTRSAEARVGDASHGGLEITNSETGHGPLRVRGFLFRLACENGATFRIPFSRASQRHQGDSSEALVSRFRAIAAEAGRALDRHLAALRTMARAPLTVELAREARGLLAKQLGQPSLDALFEALPKPSTAYDLYNAVTYRAQARGLVHRRGLEAVGGRLLERFVCRRSSTNPANNVR